ncbi:MAG: hypothetical protein OQJ80_04895 [Kangiella sp.]|nr:hypothetical protein [Kangiella sp.]
MAVDDIKLVLMTIGVTVGVIGLILTIRNRIVDHKENISVSYATRAVLVGPNMDYAGIVIKVFLLNSGNKNLHVNRPYLRTPYKKDGFDQFEMISKEGLDQKYPVKLEPGQEHSVEMSLESFLRSVSYLKPYRRIRFEVRTSNGKIFKSKKVFIRSFIKQRELHETLQAKDV